MKNEINLAKALKLKNKLIADRMKMWQYLKTNNSYNVVNAPKYNLNAVSTNIGLLTDSLIEIKTKIHNASSEVRNFIFDLSESKHNLVLHESLNTVDGKFTEKSYNSTEEVEFKAFITESEKVKRSNEIVKKIEMLQDELDAFNATTKIEFQYPELLPVTN